MKKLFFFFAFCLFLLPNVGQSNDTAMSVRGGTLKCINRNIAIGPTDGKETIAKTNGVFCGFYGGFRVGYGLNVPSPKTEKSLVKIFEITMVDGTKYSFDDLWNFLGETWKSPKQCLTQSQIIWFCKNHEDWLSNIPGQTFFFFKKADGTVFIADVYWTNDGLEVLLGTRSNINKGDRIIVPR